MDYYTICNRTPFYPKPRNDYNMMISNGVNENEVNVGLPEHLCRKYKEKGEMHFGKKIWYLGETIRKLYDIDRDPERKTFLDEYFNFMRHKGATVTKIPVVAKLPLDLFRLYQVVQKLGGFAQVVKKRRWSRVVRQLDLPSSITSAAFTLRTQYMRLLYPFECEKKGLLNQIRFYDDDRENTRCWSPVSSKHTEPNITTPSETDESRREMSKHEYRENSEFGEDSNEIFDNNSISYDTNSSSNIPMEPDSPINRKNSPVLMRRSRSVELSRDTFYDEFYYYENRPHSLDNHDLATKQEFKETEERIKDMPDSADTPEVTKQPDLIVQNDEIPLTREKIFKANQYENIQPENMPRIQREYETATTQEKYRDEFLPDMYNDIQRYDSFSLCDKEGTNVTSRDVPCPCRKCIERSYARRLSPPYLNNTYATNSYTRSNYGDNISPYYSDIDTSRYYSRSIKSSSCKKSYMSYKTGYMPKYKNPYTSTCSGEMNIKIEERTETAIALTIAVDGISYTGTLLSKIR